MILIIISFILGAIIVNINSKKINYANMLIFSVIIYIILQFIKLKVVNVEKFNCQTSKCINKTSEIQNQQIEKDTTPLMPIVSKQHIKALEQIKKTNSITQHLLKKDDNKSSEVKLSPPSNFEEEILKKIDILNTKVNNLIRLEDSHKQYNINETPHFNVDENRIRDEKNQKKRLNVNVKPKHITGYSYVDPVYWNDINRRGEVHHTFNEKDVNPSANSRFFSIR